LTKKQFSFSLESKAVPELHISNLFIDQQQDLFKCVTHAPVAR